MFERKSFPPVIRQIDDPCAERQMKRKRLPVDVSGLVARSTSDDCFICECVRGNSEYRHVSVLETDDAVVFFDRYPTLFGRVMVAPKLHLEGVTSDFSLDDYLDLQRLIYRVAEGVRQVLQPERVYLLSLGSQAANFHVHWHVAPLPFGVPLEMQQFYALMHEHGAVEVGESEQADYARRLRAAIGQVDA